MFSALPGRRTFAKMLGLGGALTAARTQGFAAQAAASSNRTLDTIAEDLSAAIVNYQMDDTHCHASNDQPAQTTPEQFLLELSGFLKCWTKWETVVAAPNERGKEYPRYMSDLFRDVKLTNAMVDTGCCEGMGMNGFNAFAQAIRPCEMRAISRAETIYGPLM